jgi:hypothetical protein
MTRFELTQDGLGMDVRFEKAALLKMSDEILDKCGEMIVHAFKRSRNELLCERDGHVPNEELPGAFKALTCKRCLLVLDNEAWDAAAKEAVNAAT